MIVDMGDGLKVACGADWFYTRSGIISLIVAAIITVAWSMYERRRGRDPKWVRR